ncbi:MAG: NUDIX hydrolase [Deltaproteobacteria bacterium]|nr:NUDIX hydrolase [Deltaproteobacteria bacterium]
MEKKIRTIASLSTRSFSAYLDEVLLQNNQMGQRIRIDHPEAAAIIPFLSDNEILMVRQFRYALGRETLEIPAGKMDPGESPEQCVRRELLEETGYEAGKIEWVYTYAPALGYSNELIHIYSGHPLRKANTVIDEREISSVEKIPIEKLKSMVKERLILDGKTLLGLSLMRIIP